MRSGRKFRMGDKVRIKVIAANLDKRQLDYEWVFSMQVIEHNGRKLQKRKRKKHGEIIAIHLKNYAKLNAFI